MYDIIVTANKVACTLMRQKYFSKNFSPPLKHARKIRFA